MFQGPSRPPIISPPLADSDRQWLAALWQAEWGGDVMVTRGAVRRLGTATSLIARSGGGNVGAVTYAVDRGTARCELLSLSASVRGQGVGSALLAAAEDRARGEGCRRIWLVTSNDNLDALRFYQRRDYRLVAVHVGAIDAARRLKSSIPLVGSYGIPLHDEIELERSL